MHKLHFRGCTQDRSVKAFPASQFACTNCDPSLSLLPWFRKLSNRFSARRLPMERQPGAVAIVLLAILASSTATTAQDPFTAGIVCWGAFPWGAPVRQLAVHFYYVTLPMACWCNLPLQAMLSIRERHLPALSRLLRATHILVLFMATAKSPAGVRLHVHMACHTCSCCGCVVYTATEHCIWQANERSSCLQEATLRTPVLAGRMFPADLLASFRSHLVTTTHAPLQGMALSPVGVRLGVVKCCQCILAAKSCFPCWPPAAKLQCC